jgi:hypothetical protein
VLPGWRAAFDSTAAGRRNMAASGRVYPGKLGIVQHKRRMPIMMDDLNRNRSLQPDHTAVEQDAKERSDKRRQRNEKRKAALDDQLDRGLEDTFPGSDPVAVTQPPHSSRDKHKP